MLNKLKEIFTSDKVISRGKEWPDESQGVLPTDWQPSDDQDKSEDVEISELVMTTGNANGMLIERLQILSSLVIVF